MTDREMLEAVAKAAGYAFRVEETPIGIDAFYVDGHRWNSLTSSADCAAMCAKLGIDTYWFVKKGTVCCDGGGACKSSAIESYTDHNNDREAAWRYAATMVAAKIGGMK